MFTIRTATASDQDVLGRYGGALMRQHHASDTRRYLQVEHAEAGYGRYLVSQLSREDSLVLGADQSGRVVGFLYADLEPTSWKDLRGPCGFVHDVYVDESARRQGVGRELVRAAVAWIHSRGMSQVVLWSKTGNGSAQRLFAALGFRSTMVEMTLDQNVSGGRHYG